MRMAEKYVKAMRCYEGAADWDNESLEDKITKKYSIICAKGSRPFNTVDFKKIYADYYKHFEQKGMDIIQHTPDKVYKHSDAFKFAYIQGKKVWIVRIVPYSENTEANEVFSNAGIQNRKIKNKGILFYATRTGKWGAIEVMVGRNFSGGRRRKQ